MNLAHQIAQKLSDTSNKYPYLGPVIWILSIQYFIVQLIVVAAWPVPYDWKHNFISDLGNTSCGDYSGLYVCSPLHGVMNLSFIVFGITIAVGAALIYTKFQRSKWSLVGFVLMILSGFGTVLVGLFPENTISQMHTIGATLGLLVGNISILVLAYALSDVRTVFRLYTMASALVSLMALGLFFSDIYLGLGRGGMERLVSYPFTVWLILFGAYMILVRIRAQQRQN